MGINCGAGGRVMLQDVGEGCCSMPRVEPTTLQQTTLTSVPDLVSDGPVLVSDWMNGCLDVPIGRCESA